MLLQNHIRSLTIHIKEKIYEYNASYSCLRKIPTVHKNAIFIYKKSKAKQMEK